MVSFCRPMSMQRSHTYFAVLTPVMGNYERIDCEPFRATYPNDMKKAIYRWRCTCPLGLKKGFCSHIFFMQHTKHSQVTKLGPEFELTDIPARADRQELSKKRGRGRPKKAAPALQRMDPNLEVDPGLKSVVANV